jgi:hypothetical protein
MSERNDPSSFSLQFYESIISPHFFLDDLEAFPDFTLFDFPDDGALSDAYIEC